MISLDPSNDRVIQTKDVPAPAGGWSLPRWAKPPAILVRPRELSFARARPALEWVGTVTALAALTAAALLSHGALADAAWAQIGGLLLLAVAGVAHVVVWRRALAAVEAHHRDAGMSAAEARQAARKTVRTWMR